MPLTGQPSLRLEDARFLSGRAQFVADLQVPGCLEAVVVRATTGRGVITTLDTTAVRQAPGVVAVYDADAIRGRVQPLPGIFHKIPPALMARVDVHFKSEPSRLLADGDVQRFGEPIAVVVADTRAHAEDGAALVRVEITPEPPARGYDGPADAAAVHASFGDNEQGGFAVSKGDAATAIGQAPRCLHRSFRIRRQVGSPMEPRGVLASYDPGAQLLTVWDTTQHQHLLRNTVASLIGLAQDEVRVIVPDMGGSFGGGMYPEDILIPFISLDLARPVRWTEQRWENLANSRHSRDQSHIVSVGYDETGRLIALQDTFSMDTGTHNFFGPILGYNTTSHVIGQYDISNLAVESSVLVSNKTPNSPVRGAGRLEAAFVIERVMDLIAHDLDLDPADVRMRNLVPSDAMPYAVGIPYRDGKDYVYDTGDFPRQLQTALDAFDYRALRVEQKRLRAEGRCVGVGIGSYVEASGYGPFEGAVVRVEPSGRVIVHSGAAPHGQSHQTMLVNLCADALAVSREKVIVRTGDSSLMAFGVGTFASRGAVTSGTAVKLAADGVAAKAIDVAAYMLNIDSKTLNLEEGRVVDSADPSKSLTLGDIAAALIPSTPLAEKFGVGLEAEEYWVPPAVTVASGTHLAAVEVDKDTGKVTILRYLVVHDCGRALNPTVVHGQVRGGVAHGIGCALMEEVVYDDKAVPVSLDFGTYPIATMPDVPDIELIDQDHPTYLNPLGAKGVGEGGAVGAGPALANAICDALRPLNIEICELPITPERLRALIVEAEADASLPGSD